MSVSSTVIVVDGFNSFKWLKCFLYTITKSLSFRDRDTHNAGFKWWSDFPLFQKCPFNLFEERVALNGILQTLYHHTAEPLVWAFGHELSSVEKRDKKHFFCALKKYKSYKLSSLLKQQNVEQL